MVSYKLCVYRQYYQSYLLLALGVFFIKQLAISRCSESRSIANFACSWKSTLDSILHEGLSEQAGKNKWTICLSRSVTRQIALSQNPNPQDSDQVQHTDSPVADPGGFGGVRGFPVSAF